MDAFELRKYSEAAFFKLMLSNSVIVSYGTITAIDLDSVEVTLSVSSKNFADKISCTFMQLGNELFSLSFKPKIGTRVVVFSPHKGAPEMYDSSAQLKAKTGKNFITSGSPAVYSSQLAFCFPMVKSTSSALSSLLIDNNIMTLEVAHSLVTSINGDINLVINKNTTVEFNEGTQHIKNCEGNMEESFGMVQGANGIEKAGTYVYKETYGKHSSVEKNYESGAKITVGKAYETPFLEDKGELGDVAGPVTIELGTAAPVTLTFGDSQITIKADTEAGLDIALKGALKINLTAETGKFTISNSASSLKDVLDKIADLFTNLTTVGPNVVVGVPYAAASDPATVALAAELKTLIAGLIE
jgi:hypothetical protein